MDAEEQVRQRGFAERFGALLRAVRHPIRAGAMSLAALSAAWGIATGSGLVAAMAGAGGGVFIGELLARTRVRLPVMMGGLLLFLIAGWEFADSVVDSTWGPRMFGPGAALGLGAVVRYAVLATWLTTSLRALAARHSSMIGVELAAAAAGFASMFASHRDGIVARPLWLSDWAWQNGYDPVHIFLGIGGVGVVILAGLLVAESKRGVSVASFLALPLLVLFSVSVLDVQGLPEPEAGNDLGLTDAEIGDPPIPTHGGGQGWGGLDQGQNQGNAGETQDPDNTQRPNQGQGQGQQQQQQGGQGGGQGQQQQQGQGGGQGQQQQQGQGQGQGQNQQEGKGGGQGQQQQQGQGGGQGQQQQQGQGGGQGQQQQQGGGSSNQPKEPDLEQQQSNSDNAPAPMAVVLLGDDYSPPSQAFYFRQEPWSHFNGSRLVAAQRPDVDLDVIRSFPGRELEVREPPPEEHRALIHAEVALTVTHSRPFALEGLTKMAPQPNPNPARFKRAYRFEALAQDVDYPHMFGRDPGHPDWSDATLEYYLQGPADGRYKELAEQLVADLPDKYRGDPFAQALKIKLWMDEQLTYSTSERHAGVADPTADFLFGNRIGYCVHFAHAAVYMWRSLGIPARIGTGYHVEEDARRGSAIVIRSGDAHAWPEIYLDGMGWVILDISAQQNLDPPGQPIDEDLTKLLADMARKTPDEQGDQAQSTEDSRDFGAEIAWTLLWVALILLAILYAIKIWRRLAIFFARGQTMPRVGYRVALDLLSEVGLSREFGESRERFARRAQPLSPAFQRLTAMHVRAKMADPTQDPATREEFQVSAWKTALLALRDERAKAVPILRRIIGLLDPLSFYRAR
jgi:transglutaminase-like putative cysteine protease